MLHEQGEQITRTHNKAVEIDDDLSRGENKLGRLGGMFSKTWKPKKTRSCYKWSSHNQRSLTNKKSKALREKGEIGTEPNSF